MGYYRVCLCGTTLCRNGAGSIFDKAVRVCRVLPRSQLGVHGVNLAAISVMFYATSSLTGRSCPDVLYDGSYAGTLDLGEVDTNLLRSIAEVVGAHPKTDAYTTMLESMGFEFISSYRTWRDGNYSR